MSVITQATLCRYRNQAEDNIKKNAVGFSIPDGTRRSDNDNSKSRFFTAN